MKCVVCDSVMVAQREWLFGCPSCAFAASTLSAGSGRGIDGLESLRRRNFATLLERLSARFTLQDRAVLEVGCAEGWFLQAAAAKGMNVTAIEPSSPHAEMARAKGFDVSVGYFPQDVAGDPRYDFIVFNDVFEHLPDPRAAIARCEALLRPGGVLVLNLPSNTGIIYRVGELLAKLGKPSTLERLWQKDFPSPHLTYFNPTTLKRFVGGETGLRHVEIFSLDTIVADGLRERIQASQPGVIGRLIHGMLLVSLPIFRFLPADIIVGVFEKRSSD